MASINYLLNEIPVIGRWTAKIGKAYQIWGMPCSITPRAWVLATWYAVPKMLISPFCPSATDYLIRRTGQAHSARTKFKWDVWDIHEANGLGPLQYDGELAWASFDLSRWGAQILWYAAWADAISDGVLNWTTLLHQYSGCTTPGNAVFEGLAGPTNSVGQGICGPAFFNWGTLQNTGVAFAGRKWTIPAFTDWSVGFSISTAPATVLGPVYPTYKIINSTSGEVLAQQSSKPYFGSNGSSAFMIPQGPKKPTLETYEWTWDSDNGCAPVTSGSLSITVGEISKVWGAACKIE